MNISTAIAFGIPRQAPAWHLVLWKLRQDGRAEVNLLRQVYGCYRPQYRCGRIVYGRRQTTAESLFPSILFSQLAFDANWAPSRSTRSVNRIVGFGNMLLPLDNSLIAHLRQRPATAVKSVIAIAANGMCSSCRISSYLKTMPSNERQDVLLVGYQART